MEIYLEVGAKKTFAGALAWPGWCRAARDEAGAVEALGAYALRYAAVVRAAGMRPPAAGRQMQVVERLTGDASTDFGAPGQIPAYDTVAPDATELKRLGKIMRACWAAFDEIATTHARAKLATGPRGGGRSVAAIRAHVTEAEAAYLTALGGRAPRAGDGSDGARDAFIDALAARARGELPERGPRGGARWPARYAVRRAAWHVLDHAWEIEDRAR